MEVDVAHYLSLAEDIDATVLHEDFKKFSRKRDSAGLVHSAWQHIEMGLNRDNELSADYRQICIDEYAQHLLASSIHATSEQITQTGSRPYSETLYHKALQLSSYIPLFSKRAKNETITPGDVDDLYSSLGAVLKSQVESKLPQTVSENVIYALSARTRQPEYVIYPASPREESSPYHPINHDGYFLQTESLPELGSVKKLPVQMKLGATALQYDSPVVVMVASELLKNTGCRQLESATDDPLYLARYIKSIGETIARETSHEEISQDDKRMLHTATRSLVSYYRRAEVQRSTHDMAKVVG